MNTLRIAKSLHTPRRVIAVAAALFVSGAALVDAHSAASPGFTVSVTPDTATIAPGASERFTVTVTSENGFAGTVHVGITSISPSVNDGPTFSLSRYDIAVSPTMKTSTARLTAFSTASTPAGTYTITLDGKDITGGHDYGLTHSTSFTLVVE
jgi:hypothetical protein